MSRLPSADRLQVSLAAETSACGLEIGCNSCTPSASTPPLGLLRAAVAPGPASPRTPPAALPKTDAKELGEAERQAFDTAALLLQCLIQHASGGAFHGPAVLSLRVAPRLPMPVPSLRPLTSLLCPAMAPLAGCRELVREREWEHAQVREERERLLREVQRVLKGGTLPELEGYY